jgi:transcriptional regulator with XRE-family HTH domain
MNQQDLAEKAGKKRPYISRIETGEDIRLFNFALIDMALGLNLPNFDDLSLFQSITGAKLQPFRRSL